jgi:hypothetical protein
MANDHPPARARRVAAALVDALADNERDRMLCRRLSIVPPKRWTVAMVSRFDQLAARLRPDLAINPALVVDDTVTGDPYQDAQNAEREYFNLYRPFVRVNAQGLVWVGPPKHADEHTVHVTHTFAAEYVDKAMWLIAARDEEAVVEFAYANGVPVTAGAAERVFGGGGKNPKNVLPAEQLTLMPDLVAPAGPPESPLEGPESDAETSGGEPQAEGQFSLFLDDPEAPQGALTVDYDGQNIVLVGEVTATTKEHLKRVAGIQWNGRERQWAIAPLNAEALLHAAGENGWVVTESARQAHGDATEKVRVAERAAEQARERSRSLTPTRPIEVPGLNPAFQLRPYQQAGIETAVDVRRVILADDVGLGKTIQALSSVAVADALPVIVVAKASLKLNWHHEITELFGWTTYIMEGRTTAEVPAVDVVIVNPDLLKARLSDLQGVDAKALIVDESHFLSNPRSQRSKALRALARPIRKREGLVLSLTATLMPNGKAMEVYPQLDMLGLLGRESPFAPDWDSFGRKYAAGYQAFGRLVVDTPIDDPERGHLVKDGLLKLNADLETYCMVRRSKRDAQPDLPPAQMSPVFLDVDKKLWAKYVQAEAELAEFLADRAAEIAKELGQNPRSAAVRARLRLECSGHEQLQSHNALTQLAVAAKFAEMVDWIDTFLTDNPDEKLLVFAHNRAIQMALAGLPIPTHNENSIQIVDWEKMLAGPLQHAREVAARFNVGTILANSDQKAESIEEDKARFQTDPSSRLMVLSLGAGSEGHTLTAAWHVAFAQLPMTAKAFRQAVGRAYGRLNDAHSVWIHPLMAGETDSIDHDTLRRIARKGAALDAVQDGIVDGDFFDYEGLDDDKGDGAADSLLDILDRRHQQ